MDRTETITKGDVYEIICKHCVNAHGACQHHWDCPLLTEIAKFTDRKTESQYDFSEYADRLWKIAYERGKREALEQTEPTISKMEQVDKDINVRSKDEPQTDCYMCKWLGDVNVCGRCRNRNLFCEAEPQTERPRRDAAYLIDLMALDKKVAEAVKRNKEEQKTDCQWK